MSLFILIVYLASILFSAGVAFIYRKQLGGRRLTILLPYLVLLFVQETVLILGVALKFYTSNAIVYNIYRPLNVLVFFWIYYNIPYMKRFRKLILSLTLVYLVLTLINYLFIESIFAASSYLTIARAFVITFFAILFLFGYFILDDHEQEKFWHPLVWITAGIVIFYPVAGISIHFQKYLAATGATFYGQKLYQIIPQVMSIFMYGCFSYAFYLCQKKN